MDWIIPMKPCHVLLIFSTSKSGCTSWPVLIVVLQMGSQPKLPKTEHIPQKLGAKYVKLGDWCWLHKDLLQKVVSMLDKTISRSLGEVVSLAKCWPYSTWKEPSARTLCNSWCSGYLSSKPSILRSKVSRAIFPTSCLFSNPGNPGWSSYRTRILARGQRSLHAFL